MKLNHLYQQGKKTLAEAPTADPGLEAFFLLQEVFGVTRAQLLAGGTELPDDGVSAFWGLVRRRLSGEPLQYILGRWEFFGLPMTVGEGVLVPRPETEQLVDRALAELSGLQDAPSPNLLDLCSGTGCIPIAIAKSCPGANLWGVERSPEAFAYFLRNISLNEAEGVAALLGDVLDLPREVTCRQYRVITANPPYVARGELGKLPEDVQKEPVTALDGGEDGLDFYRALPGICLSLLEPGGLLLLEIGEDQGRAVTALLKSAGYDEVATQPDLAGLDRIVCGRRPKL